MPEDTHNLPAIATSEPRSVSVFGSIQGFEDAQRIAKALSSSSLVPESYRGNTANTLVAMELAQRTGSSALAVMQNVHVIEGRPSWSSQFVIAALNSCGRFSPLRFTLEDLGQREVKHVSSWKDKQSGERRTKEETVAIRDQRCVAWAIDHSTGDKLEGPAITITMAVAEGWYTKPGSKWKTMPELMIRYRAAKFFGNLYAPDVLMGMHSEDEIEDIAPRDVTPQRPMQERPQTPVQDAAGDVIEGEVIQPEKPAEPAKVHPAAAAAQSKRAKQQAEPAPTEKPAEKTAEPVQKDVQPPRAANSPPADPAAFF